MTPEAGGGLSVGVVGVGAVGSQVARGAAVIGCPVHLIDTQRAAAEQAGAALGPLATVHTDLGRLIEATDIVVVATGSGEHVAAVRRALRARVPVISTADSLGEVRDLLALDVEAGEAGIPVVVGAGLAPGLSCVLARRAALELDVVDEIHVAKFGTGGPACARQHHAALGSPGWDWRDGLWQERAGGSGRELVWFPEPINGADCYRAELPDAVMLRSVFPGARRITARMAATRRDRFTAWAPMLRPPHRDGGPGGVRVELRGRKGVARIVEVVGAVADPSTGSAAVVLTTIERFCQGGLGLTGVVSLGALSDPGPFVSSVARRGVAAFEFVGS